MTPDLPTGAGAARPHCEATSIAPDDGKARIFGLDYLRAFFSICVVVIHLDYLPTSPTFDPTSLSIRAFPRSDFAVYYILKLAVPVFILISCYLAAMKAGTPGALRRQLSKVAHLLIFWAILYKTCALSLEGVVRSIPHDGPGLAAYVITAGHTIYYFLVSLLLMLPIAHRAACLSTAANAALFCLAVAVVAALPIVAKSTGCAWLIHYANPANFLPYPFAAAFIRQFAGGRARRIRIAIGSFILAAPCALLDSTLYRDAFFFQANKSPIPDYARPSVVFLSIGAFLAALLVRSRPGKIVAFMSRYSLALYCIHPFLLKPASIAADYLHLSGEPLLFVTLPLVVATSYLLAIVLQSFFRKDLLVP